MASGPRSTDDRSSRTKLPQRPPPANRATQRGVSPNSLGLWVDWFGDPGFGLTPADSRVVALPPLTAGFASSKVEEGVSPPPILWVGPVALLPNPLYRGGAVVRPSGNRTTQLWISLLP
jgi:hypothetical protein